jgi:uncharacterized protein (TIGR00255 family)
MTGYGLGTAETAGAEIRVEMKSVNSRHFDFGLKIPRAYMSIEEGLKQRVQRRVSRGKVDVFVTVDASKSGAVPSVNIEAVKSYMAAIAELSIELKRSGYDNFTGDITAAELLRLPEALTPAREDAGAEAAESAICDALELALTAFEDMRAREGERLSLDITAKLAELHSLVERAEKRAPAVVAAYRERLRAKLSELLGGAAPDEARLLTEAAIFADRTATDEETVRLRSHLAEAREMLNSDEPIGRRLDFLIQEMNREANTIGSKCNDGELTGIVIDIKAELEKLREQAQNIE